MKKNRVEEGCINGLNKKIMMSQLRESSNIDKMVRISSGNWNLFYSMKGIFKALSSGIFYLQKIWSSAE